MNKQTMQAVFIDHFGGPEILKYGTMPVPQPGKTELLISVYASGLNPVDFKIRSGKMEELFHTHFPRVFGGDGSGKVTAVGLDAYDFKIGDEVYFANALSKNGSNAEYCLVDEAIVAHKPPSLTYVEAASLPVVGLTAIQSLRDFSGLKAGNRVLIHAGAGGVGSFAIQYAKTLGAIVYTTASAKKHDFVRALGADYVIDYQKEDYVTICQTIGGMDVVLDTLGGCEYIRSVQACRIGGSVVCIVNPPEVGVLELADQKQIKTDFLLLQTKRSDLNIITDLIEAQKIKPCVGMVLPLNKVREGQEQLATGRTQGKIIIKLH